MGYYVRKLKDKKSNPKWKVQYVSCKKKDQKASSKAKSSKTTWDIPKDRWSSLGFYKTMGLDDAKVRARQLNAQLSLKRQEEKLQQIKTKEAEFKLTHKAYLPFEFVEEFEKRFVIPRGLLSERDKKQALKRRFMVWKATQ